MEKTFDAAGAERRIHERWEAADAFRAGVNAKPGAESFCIVIPPPNVTGSLHMGHALNNTIQDILTRWHRMRGHDTLWQPGQDHAGIATQMVVERQLAAEGSQGRRELGRKAFVERVWAWKEQSGGTIIDQLKRLGASCDWSRNRFTMDEGLSEAVLEMFVRLHEQGLIYRAERLVNWDPQFETAISDLEVEQVEEKGKLWRLRYKLADGTSYRFPIAHDEEGNPTEWEDRDYLVVATTRPETMLGDTGVAVAAEDARYADLVGKDVLLPLVNRRIPIVTDQHADPEKGTGAVKITPAHDFNDFQVGKRANLSAINVMGTRAQILLEGNDAFLAGTSPEPECMALHGLNRYEARKRIIALADEQGWLDGIDDETHVVPHGDRSKVAIEPYLTDQWFVDAGKLAGPALEAVRKGETRFVPQNWEKTYFNWLENIEPWCISRQLWWGHQIPVWYGPALNAQGQHDYDAREQAVFCAKSFEEAAEKARAHYGLPAIVEADGEQDLMDAYKAAAKEHPDGHFVLLTREKDVLDTWFSSALWPFSTLGWPEKTPELARYYKTDVLVTGFDIIFFWVARMMMFGLKAMDEVPFHTVYINAIVRDEHGRKMSKSIGNVIDPLDLIDKYGADALRFTLASMEALGRNDIKMSEQRVEGYRNFGTKLWNAARFAEMNECRPVADFDPTTVTATVNKWITGETARVLAAVDEALAGFRFSDAAGALYAHIWGVVCDWYVEFAKPLLTGADEAAKAETRATMAWALDQCLILLHPFMPFITEELWGEIAERPHLLCHAEWPSYPESYTDPRAAEEMGWVIRLIEAVRSVRAEMNVPAGAQIPLIMADATPEAMARLETSRPLVTRLARLGEISEGTAPKGAITVPLDGATACLPLADVIDVGAERQRLEKALAKIAKEAEGITKKLSNEKFLAKAPEEVVAEQKDRLTAAQAEAERLEAALARLREMA